MDAATSSIYASLTFNVILGIVLLILFEILRTRQVDLYQPRIRKNLTQAFPQIKPGFLRWIGQLFWLNDEEILPTIGLDAYVTLRFTYMCWKMSVCCFLGCMILISVYATNENQIDFVEGINTLSMANLEPGSSKMWASLVFSYMFTFIFLGFIYKEYEHFVDKRQSFLAGNDPAIPEQMKYSIQLENVPRMYRSNDALKEFLEQMFPNEVLYCHMIIQMTELDKSIATREKIIRILEKEISKYESHPEKKRPTIRIVHGENKDLSYKEEIDSIDYWKYQLIVINENISLLQSKALAVAYGQKEFAPRKLSDRVNKSTDTILQKIPSFDKLSGSIKGITNVVVDGVLEPTINRLSKLDSTFKEILSDEYVSSTALVTMSTRKAQITAVQINLLTAEHSSLFAIPAPVPSDIIWENLHVALDYTQKMETLVTGFYVYGLLCWGAVLAFVAALSNISSLSEYLPFLQGASGVTYSLLQGILPVVVNVTFSWLLSLTMTVIAKYVEKRKTKSAVQEEVFGWYFKYQIAGIYLLLISGSIWDSLSDAIDDPVKIIELTSASLPLVSVYFINVTIGYLFTRTPLSLLRPMDSINFIFYRFFLNQKKLLRRDLVEGPLANLSVSYGSALPDILYFLSITFLYWIIAPITLYFTGFLFLFYYISYKYRFLYIVQRDFESGGRFWFGLFGNAMTGLLVSNIFLMAYCAIKQGVQQVPFLVPLLAIILFVWRKIEADFKRSCFNLSLNTAIKTDSHNNTINKTQQDPESEFKPLLNPSTEYGTVPRGSDQSSIDLSTDKTKTFNEKFLWQKNISEALDSEPYPYRIQDLPLLDSKGQLNDVYLTDQPPTIGLKEYNPPRKEEVEAGTFSPFYEGEGGDLEVGEDV